MREKPWGDTVHGGNCASIGGKVHEQGSIQMVENISGGNSHGELSMED
jgi:hypothetical protein